MKHTDSKIREVTQLIEAGKPLHDKYRFLLFDDKHEAELSRSGTNEVTTCFRSDPRSLTGMENKKKNLPQNGENIQ
jgi:hypothetical protein